LPSQLRSSVAAGALLSCRERRFAVGLLPLCWQLECRCQR